MKQLVAITFLCISLFAKAQSFELWGVAGGGQQYNIGVLYKYSNTTQEISAEKQFSLYTPGGGSFTNGLVKHPNGHFYGVTYRGAVKFHNDNPTGGGVLFEWDPETNDYKVLYDFDDQWDALNPVGTLLLYNNLLYGMTMNGGSYGAGTVFSFNLETNECRRASLSESFDGSNPWGSLCLYQDKLYATTKSGGNGYGTLIEINPINLWVTDIHKFNFEDGASPIHGLTVINDKLYGSTTDGGKDSLGVLFEYDVAIGKYNKLVDLDTVTGYFVNQKLTEWEGNLYGTAERGGLLKRGTIFELNPVTGKLAVKYDLPRSPNAPFALVNDKFIGENGREFFEWDPTANTYRVLFDVSMDFKYVQDFLVDNNKVYWLEGIAGVESMGGCIGEWDMATDTTICKLQFGLVKETADTKVKLVEVDGKIYGSKGSGMFEWNPVSKQYISRYAFKSSVERFESPLLKHNGMLYGVSADGGGDGIGAILSYNPQVDTVSVIADLSYDTTGSGVLGRFCPNGDWLYNISVGGGQYNKGVIFAWNPTTNVTRKLYDVIGGQQGFDPLGGLVYLDSVLYGLMSSGGIGDGVYGTLFSWNLRDSAYKVCYQFYNSGGVPISPHLTVVNGKLYGTSTASNIYKEGRVFEFDPITKSMNDLYYFPFHQVAPKDGLISDGRLLFGVAYNWMENLSGELFSFDPADKTYNKLGEFNGDNGNKPGMELLYVGDPSSIDEQGLNKLVVSPNPVESVLSFSSVGQGNFILTDLVGRVVRQGKTQATVNQLNMESIVAGTYLLTLKDQNGVSTAKVIKQ